MARRRTLIHEQKRWKRRSSDKKRRFRASAPKIQLTCAVHDDEGGSTSRKVPLFFSYKSHPGCSGEKRRANAGSAAAMFIQLVDMKSCADNQSPGADDSMGAGVDGRWGRWEEATSVRRTMSEPTVLDPTDILHPPFPVMSSEATEAPIANAARPRPPREPPSGATPRSRSPQANVSTSRSPVGVHSADAASSSSPSPPPPWASNTATHDEDSDAATDRQRRRHVVFRRLDVGNADALSTLVRDVEGFFFTDTAFQSAVAAYADAHDARARRAMQEGLLTAAGSHGEPARQALTPEDVRVASVTKASAPVSLSHDFKALHEDLLSSIVEPFVERFLMEKHVAIGAVSEAIRLDQLEERCEGQHFHRCLARMADIEATLALFSTPPRPCLGAASSASWSTSAGVSSWLTYFADLSRAANDGFRRKAVLVPLVLDWAPATFCELDSVVSTVVSQLLREPDHNERPSTTTTTAQEESEDDTLQLAGLAKEYFSRPKLKAMKVWSLRLSAPRLGSNGTYIHVDPVSNASPTHSPTAPDEDRWIDYTCHWVAGMPETLFRSFHRILMTEIQRRRKLIAISPASAVEEANVGRGVSQGNQSVGENNTMTANASCANTRSDGKNDTAAAVGPDAVPCENVADWLVMNVRGLLLHVFATCDVQHRAAVDLGTIAHLVHRSTTSVVHRARSAAIAAAVGPQAVRTNEAAPNQLPDASGSPATMCGDEVDDKAKAAAAALVQLIRKSGDKAVVKWRHTLRHDRRNAHLQLDSVPSMDGAATNGAHAMSSSLFTLADGAVGDAMLDMSVSQFLKFASELIAAWTAAMATVALHIVPSSATEQERRSDQAALALSLLTDVQAAAEHIS